MEHILVSDIMTRDTITVTPNTSLLDCAKLMVKKRIGSLMIVDKKKLVGFVGQKDILWALVKKSKVDLSKIKAIEISPKKIITIDSSMNIIDVIKRMKSFKLERLPVIKDNELIGMITARDILNFHPEFYPELEEFAKIREEAQKIERIKKSKEKEQITRTEGVCEECGSQDLLTRVNGILVCISCKESM